jgi:hypothetical protein
VEVGGHVELVEDGLVVYEAYCRSGAVARPVVGRSHVVRLFPKDGQISCHHRVVIYVEHARRARLREDVWQVKPGEQPLGVELVAALNNQVSQDGYPRNVLPHFSPLHCLISGPRSLELVTEALAEELVPYLLAQPVEEQELEVQQAQIVSGTLCWEGGGEERKGQC